MSRLFVIQRIGSRRVFKGRRVERVEIDKDSSTYGCNGECLVIPLTCARKYGESIGVVLAGARKNNSRAKGTRGILLSRDDEKRDESREKRILDWSWWNWKDERHGFSAFRGKRHRVIRDGIVTFSRMASFCLAGARVHAAGHASTHVRTRIGRDVISVAYVRTRIDRSIDRPSVISKAGQKLSRNRRKEISRNGKRG